MAAKKKINIDALNDDKLYNDDKLHGVSTPNLRKDKPGRPTIPKSEALEYLYTDTPNEEAYLNATDIYLPFSNSIRADLYLKLKRIEFHRKQSMRSILEDLIEEFVKNEHNSKKPLPEAKIKKLKILRSATEYYHLRKED
jgi:hypothetical protein